MRLKKCISNLNEIRGFFWYRMILSSEAYSFCAVPGTYLRVPSKYGIKLEDFSHLIKDAGLLTEL